MRNKFKKVTAAVLVLCMVLSAFYTSPVRAEAAGFKKAFTKTVTVEGGQCIIEMDLKKKTPVTVTISTASKSKDLNLQAIIAGAYNRDGTPDFVNLDSKHKKGSFTIKSLPKGKYQLYISNYRLQKEKVKVKVSVNGKVLKYVGQEYYDDMK